MDFRTTYSERAEKLRKEVCEFIAANVPSNIEFPADTEELDDKTYAFAKEFRYKLAERGWLQPTWPKEYGGGGLSWEERFVIEEELFRRYIPKVYDLGRLLGAALLIKGNEEQKRKFLPLIAKGKIVVWQCFTEPEAGSDLAALQLQAVRDRDEFILNGQKAYCGDGHHVDYLYLLAVTDPEAPRHQNITALIVKADSPGISIDPLNPIALSRKNVVYFEDVRVPVENTIGEIGQGWSVANASLTAERSRWGDWLQVEDLLRKFLQYCKETKRDEISLADAPGSRELLVDLYIRVKIWELLDLRCKAKLINGLPLTYEGLQQSLYIKTMLPEFAAAMLEIGGPRVLVSEGKWAVLKDRAEQAQRATIMTHGAGTPEILRLSIARAIGLPGRRKR